MSRVTEIESKILQMEAGAFQEFCDAFLARKGYQEPISLGKMAGTQKTTKGVPDTYFRLVDGKYVFVEYTTQQTGVVKKIKRDLHGCLDSERTGIDVKIIQEIIYCHTSSTITPSQDHELHDICQKSGVQLTLYGVNQIAMEIYTLYPSLAADFLEIEVDSNQILSAEEFIEQYSENEMAAPLSTLFAYREEEKEKLLFALANNNVVIICGAAGTGKTRLALEVALEFSKDKGYQVYCIRSTHTPIFRDLTRYIQSNKNYLLVIDDANELSGLGDIFDYLNKSSKGYNIKILATVRDYAKVEAGCEVMRYAQPFWCEILPLKDEQIEHFLKTNLNINHHEYLRQIVHIAEGNPRLAYMAGKLAIAKQSLDAINDASQLYEQYYFRFLAGTALMTDAKICRSAGILAFVQAVDMQNLSSIVPFLRYAGLDENEFIDSIYTLNLHEYIDVRKNRVARIADQCLSNYLLYYCFYKKRFVQLSELIIAGFSTQKSSTIQVINILLRVFGSENMRQYVSGEVSKAWSHFAQLAESEYIQFAEIFHDFNPEATLLLAKKLIDKCDPTSIDKSAIQFSSSTSIRDTTLTLLSGFRNSAFLSEALQLIVRYCKICEDKVVEVWTLLKQYYSVNPDSHRLNYTVENRIAEVLINHCDSKLIRVLFLEIARHLLSFEFTPMESARGKSFRIYTVQLVDVSGAEEYRSKIWRQLLCMVEDSTYNEGVLKLLLEYPNSAMRCNSQSIIAKDLIELARLLDKIDSRYGLIRCKICSDLMGLCVEKAIDAPGTISSQLTNPQWNVVSAFLHPRADLKMDCAESKAARQRRITNLISGDGILSMYGLVETMNEAISLLPSSNWEINKGLNILVENISDKMLLISFVDAYVDKGNNLQVNPTPIVRRIIDYLGVDKAYEYLWNKRFIQKDGWRFSYFEALRSDEINQETTDRLAQQVRTESTEGIMASSNRNLLILEKYMRYNPHIYSDICSTVLDKFEKNMAVYTSYFRLLFSDELSPSDLIDRFTKSPDMLKRIYFTLIKLVDYIDCAGHYLGYFVTIDSNWLETYVNCWLDADSKLSTSWSDRLQSLWLLENYMHFFNYTFHIAVKQLEGSRGSNWHIDDRLSQLFKGGNAEIMERKRAWMFNLIKENHTSESIIIIVFRINSELSEEFRLKCLSLFLELNQDFATFESLSIEPTCMSWTGSAIPVMQQRIEFYTRLLDAIPHTGYLEHREMIRKRVESWQRRIEQEELHEIFDKLNT